MCSFTSRILWDFTKDFKPMFNRSYVDDIFVLFFPPNHADRFKEYLSPKYINVNFTTEKNKHGCLPFLNVHIFCENQIFATNC